MAAKSKRRKDTEPGARPALVLAAARRRSLGGSRVCSVRTRCVRSTTRTSSSCGGTHPSEGGSGRVGWERRLPQAPATGRGRDQASARDGFASICGGGRRSTALAVTLRRAPLTDASRGENRRPVGRDSCASRVHQAVRGLVPNWSTTGAGRTNRGYGWRDSVLRVRGNGLRNPFSKKFPLNL